MAVAAVDFRHALLHSVCVSSSGAGVRVVRTRSRLVSPGVWPSSAEEPPDILCVHSVYAKLPVLRSATSSRHRNGHVRLSARDVNASDLDLYSDDDSDSEADLTSPLSSRRRHRHDENDDELPLSSYRTPARRVADGVALLGSVAQGLASAVINSAKGNDSGRSRTAFGDMREDGIARAFWGTGKKSRTGGIKLGAGEGGDGDNEEDVPPPLPRKTAPASMGTRAGGHANRDSVSSVTSGHATLFDLGDDGDDAQELPGQVTLLEAQRLAAQGPKSSFAGHRR